MQRIVPRVNLVVNKVLQDRHFVKSVQQEDTLYKGFLLVLVVHKGDINLVLDKAFVSTVPVDTLVCQVLWIAIFVLLVGSLMAQKVVLLVRSKEQPFKLARMLACVKSKVLEAILNVSHVP